MKRLVLVVVLALSGCSKVSRSLAAGESEVTCYSDGFVIYKGVSSGVVEAEEGGAGWYFKEKDTGDFIRVSGACLFRN